MPLSVVDLYRDILPKTNCRDCGYATCLAFASMVVSEQLPLGNCPHLDKDVVQRCAAELQAQYAEGKWTRRDLLQDALKWAKERAASMALDDLAERLGGEVCIRNGESVLRLPYFNGTVYVNRTGIETADGEPLNRWEQVFVYNHLAQGGRAVPTERWKSFQEFPNTVSKVKSMHSRVEIPLAEAFGGRAADLKAAAERLGGTDVTRLHDSVGAAYRFQPFSKVPVILLFWDTEEGFDAKVKLLFDETVTAHLDIESILFLSERIAHVLSGKQTLPSD